MKKNLVLVGGGHAHMVTLANLDKFIKRGHQVTVIGPSEHHYYSGMGPGMLSKTYRPSEIRFATRQVVEKKGGKFILDKVVRIDPAAKQIFLENGDPLPYDVLSFNAGSYVPQSSISGKDKDIFSVKPIEKLMAAQARIIELLAKKDLSVGIVGGGPSAAEVAGNIWQLAKDRGNHTVKIRIFAGLRFMSRFPDNIRKTAIEIMRQREIEIIEQGYVKEVKTGLVTLENDESWRLDIIFLALGVKPSLIFKDSGLPIGPDGGLLVNRYLQCPDFPEIFGGGDCIYFKEQPLDKVGVYAVRENPILYQNLMATLEGAALTPFDPGGDYLLIFNMGGKIGIFRKRRLMFSGRLAFTIKDYIDRRFMRKFQAIE
ncbi:MAG: FAD-dependent oxidoreductase [Proteobacteria bacterium]|nr:FAD-dependent oxidoreductase [Pseudomonadota bacterium]MBU1714232.1 FAD-dependent oxidoreductase [Pseudomonadota bacterium]